MKNKLLLFLILFPLLLSGQEKQPKVGLVLSGGGAKGFAHIGVLKEIDKAGIQLDYIGGTSMGAMIGGLYAAGYSAIQIEKIILEADFNSVLRDELPRSSGTFFEKEYGEKTIVTLPVSKDGIGLPKAVSKGQNVLSMLLELCESLDNNLEFSKLPTPFFCISTNVETGAQVLLEKGSLPLALRASGSFPTLLNPVELEGQLLVDGGIANNFPVSIMKSKGMDIVIGVDVEGRLSKGEKLNSAIDIMNQVVSYQMYSKSSNEKRKLDVHIKPDIFEYGVVDFDKKEEILEKGTNEAKKFVKVFEQIAEKQGDKRKRENINITDKKLLVTSIGISGAKKNTRAFILGKLNIRNGDSLSRKDVTKRIYLLSATRNFNTIEYKFIKKVDGSYLLDFKLKESNEGANLKIGLHYDLLYQSAFLANYNKKNVLKKNDLFSLDLILGDNLRYNLNYFVDNGFYISYGFRSRFNHFRSNTKFNSVLIQFPSISKINLEYTDITNQIFVQTAFDRKFALGFGIEHKHINASTGTIRQFKEDFVIDKSDYFNVFGYLKLDTYDKKYFVTNGYFADLNFKWYLSSSGTNDNFRSFGQTKGTLGFAKTFGDRLTFQNTNEAGFTLDNPSSDIFDFYLGGNNQNYINTFVSFYGYDFAELSNNSFLKSEFNFRYRFGEKHYASLIANYGRLDSNIFKDIDIFKNIQSGYAVGYSYDSFLGPIEIKYSWSSDTKESQMLFNLGFWF